MAPKNKIASDIPPAKRQRGRPKGAPNKTTALLKDAILMAGDKAGGKGGLVGYLTLQASENPGPFMALLGKVLPTQISNDDDKPFKTEDVGAGSAKVLAALEAIAERS